MESSPYSVSLIYRIAKMPEQKDLMKKKRKYSTKFRSEMGLIVNVPK